MCTQTKVFDFLGWETVEQLSATVLIPSVLIVFAILGGKIIWSEYSCWKGSENVDPEVIFHGPDRSKPYAAIVYTCIQSVAFTTLAILLMRMKLLMTPMLCVGKF